MIFSQPRPFLHNGKPKISTPPLTCLIFFFIFFQTPRGVSGRSKLREEDNLDIWILVCQTPDPQQKFMTFCLSFIINILYLENFRNFEKFPNFCKSFKIYCRESNFRSPSEISQRNIQNSRDIDKNIPMVPPTKRQEKDTKL